MTLRAKLQEAAFWGGFACVQCASTHEEEEVEEGGPGQECPTCGQRLVEAASLLALIERAERDEAE